MSAFIVTDTTMQWVVVGIESFRCYRRGRLPGLLAPFGAITDPTELGKALFEMNADAVEHRYGERDPVPEFRFRGKVFALSQHRNDAGQVYDRTKAIRAVKAIHCLGYQCCEGDVPQRDLYKALKLMGKEISDLIVRALPEYDEESWNVPDQEVAMDVTMEEEFAQWVGRTTSGASIH